MSTETLLTISAGVTFLLAIAAFWAIWQNYSFRKEDRKRERLTRSAEELCRWAEESLKLFYLPDGYDKQVVYNNLSELSSKSVPMVGLAGIIGKEFFEIAKKADKALSNYYSEMKTIGNNIDKKIEQTTLEEFRGCFDGLQFYLSLLRTYDYDYGAFMKFARSIHALPLSEHLKPSDF